MRCTFDRDVRKPAFCICENKDADQLRGNREADQRLCFRYTDITVPLLPKYEIRSLYPYSVVVQPGLCRTWSKTPKTGCSRDEAHFITGHEQTQSTEYTTFFSLIYCLLSKILDTIQNK